MDFSYKTIDSQIKICASETYRDCYSIVIPEKINGMPVVEIGDMAFSGCKKLREVIIEDGVERIGKFAFFECISLESVQLPNSVQRVDDNSFRECRNLKKIRLSDKVILGEGVFPTTCVCEIYKYKAQEAEWEPVLRDVAKERGIDLSDEYKGAFRRLISDDKAPVFLTGAAGTGKTTLLSCFLEVFQRVYPRDRILKCAYTGVAANLLNGRTIHSRFQFDPNFYRPTSGLSVNSYRILNFYKMVKIVVIDEASMLTPDLVDAIDQALRRLKRETQLPFGGVKIIFVGDLGQLPPVYKANIERYENDYGSRRPYFFDAHVLKKYKDNLSKFVISLKKVRRQHEGSFIRALMNLRAGRLEQEDVCLFSSCYSSDNQNVSPLKRTTLYTKNYAANHENEKCLNQLEAREIQVVGQFCNHVEPGDRELFEQAQKRKKDVENGKCRYQYLLRLKKGARVMLLKNNLKGGYHNGSCGIIESFGSDFGKDDSTLENNFVEVRLLSSGRIVRVVRDVEEFCETRSVNNVEKKIRYASFSQYPLKLAWAITVHKSQGQTYDQLFIDVSGAFECGQVYTAFSRVKTQAGLRLLAPFSTEGISVDERVYPFL